jgi:hypothetical protein
MIDHDELSLSIEGPEDGNPFSTIQLETSMNPDDSAEGGNEMTIDYDGAVADGDGDYGPNDDFYTCQPGDAISGGNGRKILPNKKISLAMMVAGMFFLILGISVSKSGKKRSESHDSLKDKSEQVNPSPVAAPGSIVPSESTPAPMPDLLTFLSDTLGQKSLLVEGLFPFDAYTWLKGDSKLATYDQHRIKQRYALACIFLATNYDDTWISDDGWMSEDQECTWFGVNCNDGGKIASLSLSGNGLQGEIPDQIGFLAQYLVTLDVSVNELSNQDKDLAWLGELTNLCK